MLVGCGRQSTLVPYNKEWPIQNKKLQKAFPWMIVSRGFAVHYVPPAGRDADRVSNLLGVSEVLPGREDLLTMRQNKDDMTLALPSIISLATAAGRS